VGDLDLHNRIVMAPMTRMRADNPAHAPTSGPAGSFKLCKTWEWGQSNCYTDYPALEPVLD
jgi:hypothetical protein